MVLVRAGRFSYLLSLLAFFTGIGQVGAGEAYFLLMFGSQRTPNNPNYAHTFATFVKATWLGDGPCPREPYLEAHTISWLAAKETVRTMALKPECGRNFSLEETFRIVYESDQRVSLWGPYPIEPELYCRALKRKAELESGTILYIANDVGHRSNRVTNCIHAVSSIVDGPKLRVGSPGFGEPASYFVLRKLERYAISTQPIPWVGSALGLDEYPIHYRDYENPRSNAIFGPLYRLFGSERNLAPTYGPVIR